MTIRRTIASLLLLVVVGCGQSAADFPVPEQDYSHLGLSQAEAASLLSLQQIDGHPLYTMHLYSEYGYENYEGPSAAVAGVDKPWACTLFAALADPDSMVFGRNFDWGPSPAVLLFTDPPDGHAAAAMVDIAYLGFGGDGAQNLEARPLEDLIPLLEAHHIPFDGMNEEGLAIAMAAVGPGNMDEDPHKETIGSLGIIRLVLDTAATVEEAVRLLSSYNIDFEGGPALHYLIADAAGEVAVVEFYQGEIHIIRSETSWYQASNFIEAAMESSDGRCSRYDTVADELAATQGVLDFDGALRLLEQVSQVDTRWSVVYNQSTGEIRVVMGKDYEQIHSFELASG